MRRARPILMERTESAAAIRWTVQRDTPSAIANSATEYVSVLVVLMVREHRAQGSDLKIPLHF
jgi:hypothetical protein